MTSLEPRSFWADLIQSERTDLEMVGRKRQFERGGVLFSEGEQSAWVAVLLKGRVKAFSYRSDGAEVLLAVRGPGSLLGEMAAIDGLPRSATVVALEPAHALMITAEEFMAFLNTHGRVSILIMRTLTNRWREADRIRVEYGMVDVTGRVGERLVELAERFGVPHERGGLRITVDLSQEEIAGWVGASREAVSKALRTLRAHGWIETGRRRVIVHDLAALRNHTRQPG